MTNDNSSNNPVPNFYRASAADFKKIPGSPIAYWVSEKVREIFTEFSSVGAISHPMIGMRTGDNDRFLRCWYEVNKEKCIWDAATSKEVVDKRKKWVPYNKGGEYHKWYGNNEFLVNWENDGFEIKENTLKNYPSLDWNNLGWKISNEKYYFLSGITWTVISTNRTSFRLYENGFIFSNSGQSIICDSLDDRFALCGYLNSKIAIDCLNLISSSFESGYIKRIPFKQISYINNVVKNCRDVSKSNWDSYETSWDFTTLLLLQPEYHQPTLRETYTKLRAYWEKMTLEMQRLEEENNRIFIEAYGLQDELTPDVPLSEITLTCNPHYRYKGKKSEEKLEALLLTDTIKEFISYSVGCMFGRYSLDKPGLILANQGETINDYLQQVPEPSFMPDDDNIIPILEDEYFTDDIVSRFREFLKVTFGAESLAENLEFIAGALSKSKKGGGSPEKVIRDYFLKSFFKDHVRMYKKRPIYWLFTSGKGRGFNALVYMHRYNRETLAKMRTDYLLELEAKLDARIGMFGDESAAEKGRLGKQVEELMDYDAVLNNKSLQLIDIDLDDGIKVNYAKFEGLVGKI